MPRTRQINWKQKRRYFSPDYCSLLTNTSLFLYYLSVCPFERKRFILEVFTFKKNQFWNTLSYIKEGLLPHYRARIGYLYQHEKEEAINGTLMLLLPFAPEDILEQLGHAGCGVFADFAFFLGDHVKEAVERLFCHVFIKVEVQAIGKGDSAD
jgi:hypothetical protein